MTKQISLNTLWDSATSQDRVFHLDDFTHLPEAARRYLDHAIAPGAKLASAVRLHMHGEIKLKSWIPFKSEQVICWEHGLIWSATTTMSKPKIKLYLKFFLLFFAISIPFWLIGATTEQLPKAIPKPLSLSRQDAKQRLSKYSSNSLKQKHKSSVLMLLLNEYTRSVI